MLACDSCSGKCLITKKMNPKGEVCEIIGDENPQPKGLIHLLPSAIVHRGAVKQCR